MEDFKCFNLISLERFVLFCLGAREGCLSCFLIGLSQSRSWTSLRCEQSHISFKVMAFLQRPPKCQRGSEEWKRGMMESIVVLFTLPASVPWVTSTAGVHRRKAERLGHLPELESRWPFFPAWGDSTLLNSAFVMGFLWVKLYEICKDAHRAYLFKGKPMQTTKSLVFACVVSTSIHC